MVISERNKTVAARRCSMEFINNLPSGRHKGCMRGVLFGGMSFVIPVKLRCRDRPGRNINNPGDASGESLRGTMKFSLENCKTRTTIRANSHTPEEDERGGGGGGHTGGR